MAKSRVARCSPVPPAFQRVAAPPEVIDPRQAALAWEFLRRNLDYRNDYQRWRAGDLIGLAERWGLRAPLDPDLQDIDARRIWGTAASDHEGGDPGTAAPQPRARCRPAGSWACSAPTNARRRDRSCPCDLQGCHRPG
ncbi:transcriptional regulator domain-containing protein [Caulobacter sp. LARHSG274]